MSIWKVRQPHERGQGNETQTGDVSPETSAPASDAPASDAPASDAHVSPAGLPPDEPIQTVETESDHFVPDPSYKGVAPSAEAYRAARAALAAKLIGARYGEAADDYLEHVRLAVHAMNEDVIAPESAVQVVSPAPVTVVVPVPVPGPAQAAEPPRRRRTPVILVGLGGAFIIVALLLGSSFMGGLAPDASPTPTPTWGGVGFTTLPPVTTATPVPTKAPTRAPTKRPVAVATRRPTPRPTPRGTPTPRPLFVTWTPNPPKHPNYVAQTLPGAACTLDRWTVSSGTHRTYTMTVNASGVASYNGGAWIGGRTYEVQVTCRLNGVAVQTSRVSITVP